MLFLLYASAKQIQGQSKRCKGLTGSWPHRLLPSLRRFGILRSVVNTFVIPACF